MVRWWIAHILIALSLLVLVSQLALYGRGHGDTFPNLPADKFAAYIFGKVLAIVLPLLLGIFLLKSSSSGAESDASNGVQQREKGAAHEKARPRQTEPEVKSVGSNNVDLWAEAVEYFPDLDRYHGLLVKIDPARGADYKWQRVALRDFSKAEEQYWSAIEALVSDTCGLNNVESRDFLQRAINNQDFRVVREFIALSKKLGADNMNGSVLAKFKKANLS